MSVEKEKHDDGLENTVMGFCAIGTWGFSVFSWLSKYMEEAWKGDRQWKYTKHGKEDERVQSNLSP